MGVTIFTFEGCFRVLPVAISICTWHSWPLCSEGSLACHTFYSCHVWVVLNDELLKESLLLYFVFNSTLLSLGYSMWILLRFVKFCRRRKTIIRFIYNIFIATSYLSTCLFCLMEKFKLLKLKTLFYYKSWQLYQSAYRQKGFQKAIIQPLHFSL